MSAPRFLTLSDVAEELQVSLSQVRALVRSGELPASVTSRPWRLLLPVS